MACDLHTHSYFSDGSFSPSALVELAKERGLTVALTDHNTVEGLPEFCAKAQALGVSAVSGIELSTQHGKTELHLLGLFVRPSHYEDLMGLTAHYCQCKEQTNRETVARLCRAGYVIDYDQIVKGSPKGVINRAHIAAELTRKGYTASLNEAFDRLLEEGNGFYEAPERLAFLEAIAFLKERGICPVWAHPLKDMSEAEVRALLPQAKAAGLVGIECRHSSYDREREWQADQLALAFDLIASGGSDFHGQNKPDIALGCCTVDDEVCRALEKK